MDLNYQLGIYVGEYIVLTQLPTLSTDCLQTNTIIDVSEEESLEWKRLEDEYRKLNYGTEESTKLFYENRKWYIKILEKYLPETVRVYVPKVEITNEELFRKGVEDSLWNSDLSHYWIEKDYLAPNHPMGQKTIITLTRQISPVPEKYR